MAPVKDTRTRIIEAADALFYASGLRETSVDRIAERAGVTKRTLYYHFRSKDALIAAYLEARDAPTIERYRRWAGIEGSVVDRIERMFRGLLQRSTQRDWRGCGFIRAAVELADSPGHPALDVARKHKAAFRQWLQDDLQSAGFDDAEMLAAMLMVLLDGAVVRVLVDRDPQQAEIAATAARNLLEQARRR